MLCNLVPRQYTVYLRYISSGCRSFFEGFYHCLAEVCRFILMQKLLQNNPQNVYEINERCVWTGLRGSWKNDWKNAEGTEGSLVNKAFTAQWSPRDLCRSSTDVNRQALMCQDHCQWQLIYISPPPPPHPTPDQRKAECDLYLYLPLTGARGHWALPNANLRPPQKQQSSMSTLVLRLNFRARGWQLLQQSRNIDADAQQLTEAWDPSQCKQHNLSHHISLPEPSCWTLTEGHYKADPWPFIFTMSWLMKRSVWLLVSMLKEKESCVPYSDFNIWPLTIKI